MFKHEFDTPARPPVAGEIAAIAKNGNLGNNRTFFVAAAPGILFPKDGILSGGDILLCPKFFARPFAAITVQRHKGALYLFTLMLKKGVNGEKCFIFHKVVISR